ncbi:Fic family protein [Varunaivibrio sulfuroxidans]|uniref:Fic/DOC family protein n=1 Tax=Varunaivibrio sulfuroxidans TaxID=1773489 RepID=A0A4R3J3H7_9PROT|nr:Fic family protein [Varunaivibrio sulfuroxidans]TCS59857.1 Fic/DOC family protein [Varunaivibrio sulfuroxidans]WES29534.1 Fic family protein [Varunaivibrio sulfuroxidans]
MATPAEKLAQSLEVLQGLQNRNVIAIRSGDLLRVHRERLLANGFLHEVMKGWYIPSRPDEAAGESTAWYASYWSFCAAYLNERFGKGWCLSPEQSLSLHAGNWTVPGQLLVRAPKGGNKVTAFPHNTSLLDVRSAMPESENVEEKDGLRLYSPTSALVGCPPGYFNQNPTDVRAVLSMVRDASDILAQLLEGGHTTIASRLAGAFRNIGRDRIANDIVKTMRAADYDVREIDPFETKPLALLGSRETSPYVNRIRLMWADMREGVIGRFPKASGLPEDIEAYMARVDEVYVTDAYHSLSIEGYRVTPELIERVRSGNWNPDNDEADRTHRDALAARGYYQAFQAVKASVGRILGGENSGTVVDEDHGTWYRELFAPSVVAGVIKAADLAGYRNGPVFIRQSMHVPPSREAVRDLVPAFFELLQEETDATVRVVLGHFMFVYIHPYVDGNGRMGRFLMNAMLAAGGYPWTVVPVQERDTYMAALEEASVRQNIVPFAEFLARLVDSNLKGKPAPKVPGKE